jgi:hypothetical protein
MKGYLTWALGSFLLGWLASPVLGQQWYPAVYQSYSSYQQACQASMAGGFPAWGPTPSGAYPMPYGMSAPAAPAVYAPVSYGVAVPAAQAGPACPEQAVPPSCDDSATPTAAPGRRHLLKKDRDRKDEPNPIATQDDPLGWNRCFGQPGGAAANGVDVYCPPAMHDGHLVGGGSLYLLQPYFGNSLAFTKSHNSTTTTLNPTTHLPSATTNNNSATATDFNYDFSASPAIWFGVVCDGGVGFQGRFFRFDQFSSPLTESLTMDEASNTQVISPLKSTVTTGSIAPPSTITSLLPGAAFAGSAPSTVNAADVSDKGVDNLRFTSRLLIESFDVDATYDATLGHLGLQVACGGAYVHMAQDFKEHLSGRGVPAKGKKFATEMEQLQFGHNFSGAGPTLGLLAHWLLGDSPLAIFGSDPRLAPRRQDPRDRAVLGCHRGPQPHPVRLGPDQQLQSGKGQPAADRPVGGRSRICSPLFLLPAILPRRGDQANLF